MPPVPSRKRWNDVVNASARKQQWPREQWSAAGVNILDQISRVPNLLSGSLSELLCQLIRWVTEDEAPRNEISHRTCLCWLQDISAKKSEIESKIAEHGQDARFQELLELSRMATYQLKELYTESLARYSSEVGDAKIEEAYRKCVADETAKYNKPADKRVGVHLTLSETLKRLRERVYLIHTMSKVNGTELPADFQFVSNAFRPTQAERGGPSRNRQRNNAHRNGHVHRQFNNGAQIPRPIANTAPSGRNPQPTVTGPSYIPRGPGALRNIHRNGNLSLLQESGESDIGDILSSLSGFSSSFHPLDNQIGMRYPDLNIFVNTESTIMVMHGLKKF